MRRLIRVIVIAALVAVPSLVAVSGSAAPGTWTRITSPKGPGQPIYEFFNALTTAPTLNISGVTSNDVTAVNFFCFTNDDRATTGSPLNAAPVPVSSGEFNATGVTAPSGIDCILRAVPSTYTGISGAGVNTGYVGAFAGPTFYLGEHVTLSSGGKVLNWFVESIQQRAGMILAAPDADGIETQVPIDDFEKLVAGAAASEFNLSLFSTNLVPSGTATHSQTMVDGRNAYLPLNLETVATSINLVPAVTFSAHRGKNGDISLAETEPLRSCSGNAYPQSTGTCTPVGTGVELKRTIVTSVQGAVVTVHDRFISTNHKAHSIRIEYTNVMEGAASGSSGVRLPGKTSFSVPAPNSTKTNLPAGPNTMYLTSDLRATDGHPDRSDLGLTYSGKPTVYFPNRIEFGLRYSRHILAGGSANLSFALEDGYSMTSVTAWAKAAQKSLTDHLVITSAHGGKPTTVKGAITNPVNGLPTSVTVSSGAKHTTAKVSTSGTWKASLHLSAGAHTITVKATDPSGHKLTASVTIHVA